MNPRSYKYIYGPVPSWRLGSSLGIDLLSQEDKICNFDCLYCQLGPTRDYTRARSVYVPVEEIIAELEGFPAADVDIITFSGRGEPTLAANLGAAITAVKAVRREPVAVLTNAALIGDPDVRRDLGAAAVVIAKLDACSDESLRLINRPAAGIIFETVFAGLREFRSGYGGKFVLQMMFTEYNSHVDDVHIALAAALRPDEIQVNTPLRGGQAQPLARGTLSAIKDRFTAALPDVAVMCVYDERQTKRVISVSDADTLVRRGKVTAGHVDRSPEGKDS